MLAWWYFPEVLKIKESIMITLSKRSDSCWRLYTLNEIADLEAVLTHLVKTKNWIGNFLAKPHPELGRPGPVCPFVPYAFRLDAIYIGAIRVSNPTASQLEHALKACRDIFLDMEPKTGDSSIYKAMVLIFPDFQPKDAVIVDKVQKALKLYFTEQGLMLGEFHEQNQTPGLHNCNFFPLRSPTPALAIRHMVESDIVFLMRDSDPPKLRRAFLNSYLNHLKASLSPQRVKIAEEAISKAEEEINYA